MNGMQGYMANDNHTLGRERLEEEIRKCYDKQITDLENRIVELERQLANSYKDY